MTGKRESSKPNESSKSTSGRGSSKNGSKDSSRKNSVSEQSSEIPLPGTSTSSADLAEESLKIPKEEDSSNNLQLVPVHITSNTDYNTSNSSGNSNINNSGSHYSSNSSVDSQYKYHGDRSGGYQTSYSYNPVVYRHPAPYSNRIPVPAIPQEQININIQKNIEHCAQQQRQQMENIIRNNNEATQFLSRGSLIVRMRGLPYDCNPKQVVEFFESGENGVKLHEHEDGVLFVRKADGRATGDAFVLLSTEEDVTKALTKHRDLIGSRYIELFRSTSAEVMNRSMDVRHLEQQAPQPTLPPLIAMPPMMPQQSVAQGPKKDCIRLRGLPFEAGIDHVLEFLGDFAKNIMFRGVHMVYTAQGQPSGEAFIQMTSESAAWTAAHHRHNRFMPCAGKKHRYIEVFQCSGDDMNLVLSGAAPVAGSASPVTSAPPPPAPGSLVPTPGGMLMWDDGSAHSRGVAAAAAAAAPPLLLPPPHMGQGPHVGMQQSLSMAGLPSLSAPPSSPTGYMSQSHAIAAAAAAAAAAAGIRPPSFPPNMAGPVPHTLLPPPSNGMTMLPSQFRPSMKQQSQLLLPPPLSGNSRPPQLEDSLAQVSHGSLGFLVKTTTVSAAGYPTNMFTCYPTSTSSVSASHSHSPVSPTMLYYQAPNVKLPTTLSSVMSMPPNAQLQYYTAFPPMPADTTTTSKYTQQLHYLPAGSYASVQAMAPPPRRMPPPHTTASSQSVTSKRSYDQAFPSGGDRNGGGANTSVTSSLAGASGGSGANGGAKRLAVGPASGSSHPHYTPRPTVMPSFSQSAHFAQHQLAAHHLSPQFASAALNPALGGNPMGAPMLHALYPPPMYPSM